MTPAEPLQATNMNPLKINAEWDNEASVWVASCDDMQDLMLAATKMDDLVEQLKVEIPKLMASNQQVQVYDELSFMLVKSWPVTDYHKCF